MNFSFEKKDFKKLFIWYSISFAIVAFFVYGSYYFSGHSLIWQIDGSQQHLPLLINYRKALIEFLSKELKIPKTSFEIIKGSTSKEKTICIKIFDNEKIQFVKKYLYS